MKNKVSVAIITRNRARDLRQSLAVLAGQSLAPDELVVIDSISTDDTAQVVKNFGRAVKFKVKYICTELLGFPLVRNLALELATGNWVAFIDDDSVAHPDWYRRIKFMTTHLPQLAAIRGATQTYYPRSVAALTKSLIDEFGLIGAVRNRLITDHEILDVKNVVYNKQWLRQQQLHFDNKLLKYGQGASEDCDLGMQIFRAGGLAIHDSEMRAWHKDQVSLRLYYQKMWFNLRNHLIYEHKWEKFRAARLSTRRSLLAKLGHFWNFRKRYQLNWLATAGVLINLMATFICIKILRRVLRPQVAKLKIKQI